MSLSGKVVCFTGALAEMKRAAASKAALGAGASKVSKSVTKATDILVCGADVGATKIAAAEKKGVEVWTEAKFMAVLNGGDNEEEEEQDDSSSSESEEEEAQTAAKGGIAGQLVCFTGKLKMPRAEASKLATGAGAKVSKTVTKATNILVCGAGVGATKIAAAKKKGADVWTEAEFMSAVNGGDTAEAEDDEEEEEEEDDDNANEDNEETSTGGIAGKVVCFTGKLQMPRAEASKLAVGAGAKVSKTVTKATEILVCGADVGATKISAAKKKGVEIWTEKDFLRIVNVEAEDDEEDEEEEDEEEEETTTASASSSLAGKVVCFTGTLKMKRAEATEKALAAGASKVPTTVTKATDILVCGTKVGAKKIEGAKKKGVEIWTEAQFQAALGSSADAEEDEDDDNVEDDDEEVEEEEDTTSTATSSSSLTGKFICFTGTLTVKRAEAESKAVAAGAKIVKTLNKKTNILVCGEKVGATKMNKAKKANVEIWTEAEFNSALGGSSSTGSKKRKPSNSGSGSKNSKKTKRTKKASGGFVSEIFDEAKRLGATISAPSSKPVDGAPGFLKELARIKWPEEEFAINFFPPHNYDAAQLELYNQGKLPCAKDKAQDDDDSEEDEPDIWGLSFQDPPYNEFDWMEDVLETPEDEKKYEGKDMYFVGVYDAGNWCLLMDTNDPNPSDPNLYCFDHETPTELDNFGPFSKFLKMLQIDKSGE